ncbi:EYxxD motif small membrane protein [Bacillus pinisoli]
MFMEYVTDMSFVLITIIGGIIAISYAFIKRKRAR